MRPRNSIAHDELAAILPPLAHPSSRIDPALITKAAEHLGRFTSEHLLKHLALPVSRANEMAVAKHLYTLGYTKSRVSVGGSLHYVFFPPLPTTPANCSNSNRPGDAQQAPADPPQP